MSFEFNSHAGEGEQGNEKETSYFEVSLNLDYNEVSDEEIVKAVIETVKSHVPYGQPEDFIYSGGGHEDNVKRGVIEAIDRANDTIYASSYSQFVSAEMKSQSALMYALESVDGIIAVYDPQKLESGEMAQSYEALPGQDFSHALVGIIRLEN